MSPRRPRRQPEPSRPDLLGLRTEDGPDGQPWQVRPVSGARAEKTYRCPGCDQVIPARVPHVVVWPAEPSWSSSSGLEERRHWHTSCWQRRR